MTVKTTIDIEDLVRWTYQVQRADLIVGSGIGLYESEALVDGVGGFFGGSGDSCTRVRRAAALGCKVDGGGFNPGELHPDAEAVHEAVMGLIVEARSAGFNVLQFGIAGLRPDWREDARPRWEPARVRQPANGDRDPIYEYNPDAGIGNRPWFCPLRLIDDPVSIDYARRVYATWRGELVVLAILFGANRERLCAHAVTGPVASVDPWKTHRTTLSEKGVDRLGGNR